ncbi:3-ketoacyl-CoA thiolase B, peroxisomal [Smittium mucronatum]|uniref:3-ketoacyl-CoA thiolase B, peroxisomal n=1 Tax=Smittium mucronatum TaxID=133383 RepID=A0A1R0H5J5_9FUNG|nr:3-ketoacyl-CoA thiolase B, peroxisomal [Smittium mucronatum]
MASNRLNQLASHLSGNQTSGSQIGIKNPEDIVIVSAVRTPICKAGRGKFKDTHHEYLLSLVLKSVCEKAGLDKALVEDIIVGNVLPPSGGASLARMAMLYAGFPESSSIASAIRDGTIEIGIGAGVESMSSFGGASAAMKKEDYDQALLQQQNVRDCLLPMGITSENVASDFGITREQQDRFSAASHQKAANAQKNGYFNNEIIPVPTKFTGPDGKTIDIVVTADDGVRPTTTLEGLSKLKPVFKKDGSTTAGNASQVSDGAAAVLLMKRSRAIQLGLPILGKYLTSSAVGVPPRIMGVGPAYAIPAALKKAGLSIADIDIFEINEAFASQAVYSIQKLGIDMSKVNPNGGAVAFGHPLGCTGARQISTLLYELRRTGKHVGLTSMCIGSGMGMCAIFEAEW